MGHTKALIPTDIANEVRAFPMYSVPVFFEMVHGRVRMEAAVETVKNIHHDYERWDR
jgi:hypothetical protein